MMINKWWYFNIYYSFGTIKKEMVINKNSIYEWFRSTTIPVKPNFEEKKNEILVHLTHTYGWTL